MSKKSEGLLACSCSEKLAVEMLVPDQPPTGCCQEAKGHDRSVKQQSEIQGRTTVAARMAHVPADDERSRIWGRPRSAARVADARWPTRYSMSHLDRWPQSEQEQSSRYREAGELW